MELKSERRRFAGLNVKRTLGRRAVEADLEAVRQRAPGVGVLALQEFQTRGHWLAFRAVLGRSGWSSFPGVLVGLARPVWSGQAIAWDRSQWRKRAKRRRQLHQGAAGITESRSLRAVLLEDRTSGLPCWFGTTHFVVGGDQLKDGRERRQLLADDLTAWSRFLGDLVETGHPGVFQLDANLRPSSDAWDAFLKVVRRHGCTIQGVRGVEYLVTWQGTWSPGPDGRGRRADTGLDVATDFTVAVDKLNTDHEARGIVFRLTRELALT